MLKVIAHNYIHYLQ